MSSYILIIIADILLVMTFVMQKKYQNSAGTSEKAGIIYNALLGLVATVIYLGINEFKIEISLYSVVMAILFTTFALLYVMIGFKIMENGNMSLYTLFLLSGGMTVPYIYGIVCLDEKLTVARVIGIIAILFAIIISNLKAEKIDKKQLFRCIAVFLLNGFVSVISKTHQINPVSKYVTSSDFTFLVVAFKAVFCMIIILARRKKWGKQDYEKISVKKVLPFILIAALADSVSFMLQLIAAKTLPATVLYPFVTGASVFLTSLAGVLVFKEKMSAGQWAGVAICFAGTLMFL